MAMSAVTRLVTFVDLADGVGDTRQTAFSAQHEAVLLDGRRVLLLDDRGWTWSSLIAVQAGASDHDSTREEQPDIWATTSVEDIEQTARMVVGPDEPTASGLVQVRLDPRLHDVVVAAAANPRTRSTGSPRALTMITGTSRSQARPGSPSRRRPQTSNPEPSGKRMHTRKR